MNTQQLVLNIILELRDSLHKRPIIIGIQGPQGSGKSYTASKIADELNDINIKTSFFSLDDFYLDFSDISQRYPDNLLLCSRGLPGTHDYEMMDHVFQSIAQRKFCKVPTYDKALNYGSGGRVKDQSQWTTVPSDVEIVLFEGWMLGFKSIRNRDEFSGKFDIMSKNDSSTINSLCKDYSVDVSKIKAWLSEINQKLSNYESVYSYFDLLIKFRVSRDFCEYIESEHRYSIDSIVLKWRSQQERNLAKWLIDNRSPNKAHDEINFDKKGTMSTEKLRVFIRRFLPIYALYDKYQNECIELNRLEIDDARMLIIDIDANRLFCAHSRLGLFNDSLNVK